MADDNIRKVAFINPFGRDVLYGVVVAEGERLFDLDIDGGVHDGERVTIFKEDALWEKTEYPHFERMYG